MNSMNLKIRDISACFSKRQAAFTQILHKITYFGLQCKISSLQKEKLSERKISLKAKLRFSLQFIFPFKICSLKSFLSFHEFTDTKLPN